MLIPCPPHPNPPLLALGSVACLLGWLRPSLPLTVFFLFPQSSAQAVSGRGYSVSLQPLPPLLSLSLPQGPKLPHSSRA